MFEEAEKDPALDDDEFEAQETELRTDLLVQQYELLKRKDRTVLVVVAGLDGAGKGSTVNLLNEWLDPRHVHTLAFGAPNEQEASRPAMWRYWSSLPPKGQVGIVFGSWYMPLIAQASRKKPDAGAIAAMAASIGRFESMLAADGVQIVKLWFHLSKAAQQARCKALLSDPDTAWRVSDADLKVARKFARLSEAGRNVIRATHTEATPWIVIPSADENWRIVATARTLLRAFRHPSVPPQPQMPTPAVVGASDALPEGVGVQDQPASTSFPDSDGVASTPDIFTDMDYSASLSRDDYEQRMTRAMARVGRAVRRRDFRDRALVLVFEGEDAAGKGGAIRRITRALDARQYSIVPVSAPTDEERVRPYLWRFWRRIPSRGRITIFDRSWYGRVLVERVEGYATPAQWQRAYAEISEFESQCIAHGIILVKFWLSITSDEQLKRFEEREQTPFKSFKITEDDWRNRAKAPQYREAASEMLARTDMSIAPWTIVASDDKRYARVTVMETVARALEMALSHDDD